MKIISTLADESPLYKSLLAEILAYIHQVRKEAIHHNFEFLDEVLGDIRRQISKTPVSQNIVKDADALLDRPEWSLLTDKLVYIASSIDQLWYTSLKVRFADFLNQREEEQQRAAS